MGAGIRKKAAINGIIEEQGRTILDGEVVDDESFVLVIVEQVRDPKFPELGVGEQANDVADVVAPESPEISGTNRLKILEELLYRHPKGPPNFDYPSIQKKLPS